MCCKQDVVTRGGKMVFLYSRPGQRVLVNSRGDMIVRPSWVEASLQRLPGGVLFNLTSSAPLCLSMLSHNEALQCYLHGH